MVEEYYIWLHELVGIDSEMEFNHEKLFGYLFNTEYTWILPMDSNRKYDGLELRERFAAEYDYPNTFWYGYLPNYCSVLEMMIGLANRCENDILYDPSEGDHTGMIFWEMIDNLGLCKYDDSAFDPDFVGHIVDTFLARKYTKSGLGNLFHTKKRTIDMRTTEIWYQMNYYINEKYE